ncbi:MAG: hypothetical protein RIS94_2608 [Pseudomonadota bacterium]|jgi:hypothetical protein
MVTISLAVFALFWLIVASNSVVALAFGRRAERAFALLLLGSSMISTLAQQLTGKVEMGTAAAFASDWAILAVVWVLALRSDRFWPVWFAGFQTLAIANQLLAMSEIGLRYRFLANMSALWALPAMVIMAWGTVLDHRRERRSAPAT